MSFVGGRALALVRPLRVRGWSLAGPGSRPARPPMMCDNKRERDQMMMMMGLLVLCTRSLIASLKNATSCIYLAALVNAFAVRLFDGALSPFAIRLVRAAMQQCALVRGKKALYLRLAARGVLSFVLRYPATVRFAVRQCALMAGHRRTCTQYSTAQSRKRSAHANQQKKPCRFARPFFDQSFWINLQKQEPQKQ